ncbi:MAG: hypothetical protein RML10_08690 [Geminocystis sp.]|nr:hypothetical protein [Geminocystis sp.]MDW8463647.1 hypothetical protein [Geminocystis sp.]
MKLVRIATGYSHWLFYSLTAVTWIKNLTPEERITRNYGED